MTTESLQTLTELERITRMMLNRAECAAWEHVEALEQERKTILQHDLGQINSPVDHLPSQARLRKIIELDNQVMALARTRRQELSKQLDRLNRGRKASRAYQHCVLPK